MNLSNPQYVYRLIPTLSPAGDEDQVLVFEVICNDKYYGDFKMSKPFLTYILNNAICTRCLEMIGEVEHLNTCGKPAKSDSLWSNPRNRMCYMPYEKSTEFREYWNRERVRYRSFQRKSKLWKFPLPPEGILLQLKDKQENRCYYCFNEFKTNSSDLKPHLDHFVSVTNGGSNSIFNLVYACGRCNREKCSENGEQFIKTLSIRGTPAIERLAMMERLLNDHYQGMPELNSPEHGAWAFEAMQLLQQKQYVERESKKMPIGLFPSDIRRNINKMRRSVREWKEQFKPEYLSHVERLRKEHYRKMPHTRTSEFDKWLAEEHELLLRWEYIRGEIRKS